MISVTPEGLFCESGGLHVDPVRPVPLALSTSHRALGFGQRVTLGRATVSLHPSGDSLGRAQARIEVDGQVAVVARHWKRERDPTCPPFELVRADVFVTGAAWALPIFRWPEPASVVAEIVAWWERNRAAGRAALLLVENAPRLLAELGPGRPAVIHPALEPAARAHGLAPRVFAEREPKKALAGELVLAPPEEEKAVSKRLGPHETALVSPLMRLRGTRRRRAIDRGFVLADEADWPSTLRTIEETGARRVLAIGAHAETLARYLREQGRDAAALEVPA